MKEQHSPEKQLVIETNFDDVSLADTHLADVIVPQGGELRYAPPPILPPNFSHRDIGLSRPYIDYSEVWRGGQLLRQAARAIDDKAAALEWVGHKVGMVRIVDGGFRQTFEHADIYYSEATGAHEVHGDIRAKFNAIGGPSGLLGFPTTDEISTPDGIGRFNHFANAGSIYWTPSTGPMMVRGTIRDRWASLGWENGPLGYPIADYYRLPGLLPNEQPTIAWSLFQNGGILQGATEAAEAVFAEIAPDSLRAAIRTIFDKKLKGRQPNLGLEAEVGALGQSEWMYGFWRSIPRSVGFHLRGFHDNGVFPDTTFTIELRLRFSTAWSMNFSYPGFVTLIASLDWLKVSASGLEHGQAREELFNGIRNEFFRGHADLEHPEVPDGSIFLTEFPTGVSQSGAGSIDVLDVLVTKDGALRVLLNPLPPVAGGMRSAIAQMRVDAFVQNL